MAEHMQTMQENMQRARSVQADTMGCPMMEGGMMGGGTHPDGSPERMRQMELRMDIKQDRMKMMMARMPQPATK